MTNVISVSFGDACDVFKRLRKMCPEGKSFSKFVVFVCQDWIAKKDMASFLVDDSTPNDDAPLEIWKEYINTGEHEELKKLLIKRRSINTLLEMKLLD